MNKTELASAVAKSIHITKKAAEEAVDAVFETITDTLAKGEKVRISGFGVFETVERAARKGRNPQTGEEIDIPATVTPKFKAGKALKEAVK